MATDIVWPDADMENMFELFEKRPSIEASVPTCAHVGFEIIIGSVRKVGWTNGLSECMFIDLYERLVLMLILPWPEQPIHILLPV